MANYSNDSLRKEADFIDIELGNLTPRGRAQAPAIHAATIQLPLSGLPLEEKKGVFRRKCIDPLKRFCGSLASSIVLLTLFIGIFPDPEMTDEMRDGIEKLPGYNKGTYH
ncbi:hypothetical protein IFR04_001647 [Cadophora malorum]|uniref:Uncharacterized protein n=1 Tax=Cadophora malorum TaxID=108018 RepID=A0A8H7WI28_9HELO|nr:hypothetical protein IFR04_001647 [Cadophora malorum]